jgi:hypothetical protein
MIELFAPHGSGGASPYRRLYRVENNRETEKLALAIYRTEPIRNWRAFLKSYRP